MASCLAACLGEPTESADGEEVGRELLGGDTTVFDDSGKAYTYPARNLGEARRDAFALGDHFFNRNWVTAPASASGNDGLGPTFNATSCSACHALDGRGAPPTQAGEPFLGLLLRLSVPGESPRGGPLDEPTYGGQFNHRAILSTPPEGRGTVEYEEVVGTFTDGEAYSLRRPTYAFAELAYGPMRADTLVSPRVAPPMYGLGLLEAIAEATLTGFADAADRDGDGISGRPNYVWNQAAGRPTIGRFGWKANQPTVRQQTAGAFLGDIGITSSLEPAENCPAPQVACRAARSGGERGASELSDQKLDAVVSYGMTLAVPARRGWRDAAVVQGEALFLKAQCASCHMPKMKTGVLPDLPELSNQTIRPYTDLLLHDMGEPLADHRPDFEATGTEWRTPPLWGIGLLPQVNRHQFLMHDGRARGFAEAILWHGGEGERAKESFRAMSKSERAALLKFLESL